MDELHIITNNTKCWVLPQNTMCSLCIFETCHCQQHKTDACCNGNATCSYTPLSSYKIFCTALSNINVHRSQCKVPHIYLILRKFGFYQIFTEVWNIKFEAYLSSGSQADTRGQTNVLKPISTLYELCVYALNGYDSKTVMAYFKILFQHRAEGNDKSHKKPQTC
jgi:hypothetical protein